jgi:hypothetical protein
MRIFDGHGPTRTYTGNPWRSNERRTMKGKNTDWKNSRQYKRIIEILEDYWTTEPDEAYVRIDMLFIKGNGETQEKSIVWMNQNMDPDKIAELRRGEEN